MGETSDRLLRMYPLVMQMAFAERLLLIYTKEIDLEEFRANVTHHWSSATVNTREFVAYRRMVIERERKRQEGEFWRIHG